MHISGRFTINASATKVWEIVATHYQEIGQWASSVTHSQPNCALPGTEVGRVCHTAFGTVAETITACDEEAGLFAYRTEKPPFFIRRAANTLRIQPDGPNRCHVQMTAEIELLPWIGFWAYPLIRAQLRRIIHRFVEELQYYAEKEAIHPRKLKARRATGHLTRG